MFSQIGVLWNEDGGPPVSLQIVATTMQDKEILKAFDGKKAYLSKRKGKKTPWVLMIPPPTMLSKKKRKTRV